MEQLYFYGTKVDFSDRRLRGGAKVYFVDTSEAHEPLRHGTVSVKTAVNITVKVDEEEYTFPANDVTEGKVRLQKKK